MKMRENVYYFLGVTDFTSRITSKWPSRVYHSNLLFISVLVVISLMSLLQNSKIISCTKSEAVLKNCHLFHIL